MLCELRYQGLKLDLAKYRFQKDKDRLETGNLKRLKKEDNTGEIQGAMNDNNSVVDYFFEREREREREREKEKERERDQLFFKLKEGSQTFIVIFFSWSCKKKLLIPFRQTWQ